MPDTIAIKRLAAVEVEPGASHQREFHADRLRRELGIDGDRVEGPLLAAFHPSEGAPLVEDTTYTFYQARKPPRSEFRLYPATTLFQEHAHPGDLLLVFRSPVDDGLRLVVAERGSRAEAEILDAFFRRDVPSLDSFRYVTGGAPAGGIAKIGAALTMPQAPTSEAIRQHQTYRHATETGEYPRTADMVTSAREIIEVAYGDTIDPDVYLDEGLAAETKLFFAIEQHIASQELSKLIAEEPDLAAVLEWSTKRLNSRKSRRGRSLQGHFEHLLRREGIPFSAECTTGEPPPADILVPSCADYHDAGFPADRLRLVSCKSTLKERWMEVVPEAGRINTKYLLTLDDKITDNVLTALGRAKIRTFLPARVIATAYSGRTTQGMLSTVTQLVEELRTAVG
jgi:hypothetical protein